MLGPAFRLLVVLAGVGSTSPAAAGDNPWRGNAGDGAGWAFAPSSPFGNDGDGIGSQGRHDGYGYRWEPDRGRGREQDRARERDGDAYDDRMGQDARPWSQERGNSSRWSTATDNHGYDFPPLGNGGDRIIRTPDRSTGRSLARQPDAAFFQDRAPPSASRGMWDSPDYGTADTYVPNGYLPDGYTVYGQRGYGTAVSDPLGRAGPGGDDGGAVFADGPLPYGGLAPHRPTAVPPAYAQPLPPAYGAGSYPYGPQGSAAYGLAPADGTFYGYRPGLSPYGYGMTGQMTILPGLSRWPIYR